MASSPAGSALRLSGWKRRAARLWAHNGHVGSLVERGAESGQRAGSPCRLLSAPLQARCTSFGVGALPVQSSQPTLGPRLPGGSGTSAASAQPWPAHTSSSSSSTDTGTGTCTCTGTGTCTGPGPGTATAGTVTSGSGRTAMQQTVPENSARPSAAAAAAPAWARLDVTAGPATAHGDGPGATPRAERGQRVAPALRWAAHACQWQWHAVPVPEAGSGERSGCIMNLARSIRNPAASRIRPFCQAGLSQRVHFLFELFKESSRTERERARMPSPPPPR